jgi:hypothetical protein
MVTRDGTRPEWSGAPPIARLLDEPVRKPRAKNPLPHQFGFCALNAQKPGPTSKTYT